MVNDINCPSQNSQTVLVCFGEHEAAKLCCVQSSASCKASRRAKLLVMRNLADCKTSRTAKLCAAAAGLVIPGEFERVRAFRKFRVIPDEFERLQAVSCEF